MTARRFVWCSTCGSATSRATSSLDATTAARSSVNTPIWCERVDGFAR